MKKPFRNTLNLSVNLLRYNLKILFANKFIHFMLSGLLIFIIISAIIMFDADANPSEATVYYALLLPGLLIIFYPVTFGIHNDMEWGMSELLSGIPNYRYKVWLVRLVVIYLMVIVVLLALSLFSRLILHPAPVFEMSFQLMFPVFFFGSFAFMVATFIRSGNGTAAVMVIFLLIFWISSGILEDTRWNIFLNPFDMPGDLNETIWRAFIFYNRLYLMIGTILAILAALYRLQKREKLLA